MNGLFVPLEARTVFTSLVEKVIETEAVFILGNSRHSSSFFVCVLFSFLISTFFPKWQRIQLICMLKGKSPEAKAEERKRERIPDGTRFLW